MVLKNKINAVIVTLISCVALTGAPVFAAEKGANRKPAAMDPHQAGPKQKNLKFEDGVVEGMNQRSRDSLSQLGDPSKRARGHLYKKRTDFADEMQELYRETEYSR